MSAPEATPIPCHNYIEISVVSFWKVLGLTELMECRVVGNACIKVTLVVWVDKPTSLLAFSNGITSIQQQHLILHKFPC